MDRPLVLVAEDDPNALFALDAALSTQYRVVAAHDGQEAWERIQIQRPDVILTDLNMPKMSGEELVARVRQNTAYDAVPIIVLTGETERDLRVRLLTTGAQDYIEKPVELRELAARVAVWARMSRVRTYLQRELDTRVQDIETLVVEATERKAALAKTVDDLEQARAARDAFLRNVSHELMTPLTVISLSSATLARATDLPEHAMKAVDRLSKATARLEELITAILNHTKAASGFPI